MAVLPIRLVIPHWVSPNLGSTPEGLREQAPSLSFELVRGTLLELSGDAYSARTTTAARLALEAQRCGEPVVWVERDDEGVYGADLAEAGLDLDAFVLVRVDAREGPAQLFRAAEIALRSGGFGLAYVDLGAQVPRGLAGAWQGRLLGLAREHRASVVIATSRDMGAESLGPLISLRVAPTRKPRTPPPGPQPTSTRGLAFEVDCVIAKSKRGDVQALASLSYSPPSGL